jgi:hypothetical protein
MSGPEPPFGDRPWGARRGPFDALPEPPAPPPRRYGRYVALLALLILVLITINTIVTKPNGAKGVPPGEPVPPFAVPLATSNLTGDADVATAADQGALGRVPACRLRGPRILNVCELYEHGPLVLVLFVNGGSCTRVLSDVQSLLPSFPGVNFAAVALGGDHRSVSRLIRARGLSFPIGVDRDGALLPRYKVASCPQITFVYPGGIVESAALLTRPAPAVLRARVQELVNESHARERTRTSPATTPTTATTATGR